MTEFATLESSLTLDLFPVTAARLDASLACPAEWTVPYKQDDSLLENFEATFEYCIDVLFIKGTVPINLKGQR
jgi:hypothetical protein